MYVILFALLVLGACAFAIVAGRRRFRTFVTADVRTLFSNAAASVGPDQLQARWNGLPEPVRRYLSYAIPKDAPAVRTARLKHDGFFRTKPGERWFPIKGVLTPWVGRSSDYRDYVRFRVTTLEYNVADRFVS